MRARPLVDLTYLTMQEAGALLRFDAATAAQSARRFCHRHGIPLSKRGNAYLVRRSILESYLDTGETGVRERIALHRKLA